MKIKQLKERLNKFDPEAEAYLVDQDGELLDLVEVQIGFNNIQARNRGALGKVLRKDKVALLVPYEQEEGQ